MEVLFVLALICPISRIENRTGIWTSEDAENLEGARIGCKRIYRNSPCVVRFRKIETRNYQITCGRMNNANSNN